MINYIKSAIDHYPMVVLWILFIVGMSADSIIDNLFTLVSLLG